MGGGWIPIDRDIRDSWLWDKSPVKSYFEAWTDMLMGASYKQNKVLISGNFVHLKRGQLAWSISFMATRWGWSAKKVRVFLQLLVKNESILGHSKGSERGKGVKVISICNYNDYQDIENTKGKAGASKGARQGQGRGKNITKEQVNHITIDQKTSSISDEIPRKPAPKSYNEDFIRCWEKYPKRSPNNSKQKASIAFNARIKSGVPLLDLEAGLDRYIQYCQQADILNTSFVKLAATFFGTGEDWKEDWLPPRQKKTGSAASEERNQIAMDKIKAKTQEIRNERARITTSGSHGTALATTDPILW